MILYTKFDVGYLPFPNSIETIASDEVAPRDLITTAFVIPLFNDKSVLLAHNLRRGLEIPGGHIEPGETAEEAAIRELVEEGGATVFKLHPIGYQKMVTGGEAPNDWRYPYPISYQQFFAGMVDEQYDYIPNDECRIPLISRPEQVEVDLKPEHYVLYEQAIKTLQLG